MGYTAQPFAVDINKVRQVLGSNDLTLIERFKSSDMYDNYADQSDSDFDEVLRQLISDYIPVEERKASGGLFGFFKSKPSTGLDPKLAHEYGYALLVICDTLGTYLSPTGDVFYAGDTWKEANQLLTDAGSSIDLDRMWKTENLFNLPEIADFPVINQYTRSEIDQLLQALDKIEIDEAKANSSNDDFDELQELLFVFRKGLLTCKNEGVEWVSFLH